ncbi:chemerin-like receptor 1 [Lissotriton helveticus]
MENMTSNTKLVTSGLLEPFSLDATTFPESSVNSTTFSPLSVYTAFPPLSTNFTGPEEFTTPGGYYDCDKEEDETTKAALHGFTIFIYFVAFFLGVTGNGLVIWITGFKMKRTVNTVWFLNLAIADFIFTFFLPLSITYIALGFHWPFGKFMCKLNSTVAFLNMFASIFFLMVISIDRCISVIRPVWSQNHRTPRLAIFIALAVWAASLIVSLPYFIFRTTVLKKENATDIICYNEFWYDDTETYAVGIRRYSAVIWARFVIGFFLPFSVIVICYITIAIRLSRNRLATSSKPFKIIVAVIVCFCICWFPYHVFSFLELAVHAQGDCPGNLQDIGVPITTSLAFINSCVNPILYVFVGRDFKEKFRTSILAVLENAFIEEASQSTNNTAMKSKSNSTVESQTRSMVETQIRDT